MTIERISLLRNVGQFDNVSPGAQLPLTPFSVIYAENGRGKTTLSAILKSLSSGDPSLIQNRKRLKAQHEPHVIIQFSGASAIFQNGAWSATQPEIHVFDDAFVAENVCSGIEIETSHRQNLHELILGAKGVALSKALQGHVERIEQHNKDLRAKQDAIPAAARGPFSVDAFCGLSPKRTSTRRSRRPSAGWRRPRPQVRSISALRFSPSTCQASTLIEFAPCWLGAFRSWRPQRQPS